MTDTPAPDATAVRTPPRRWSDAEIEAAMVAAIGADLGRSTMEWERASKAEFLESFRSGAIQQDPKWPKALLMARDFLDALPLADDVVELVIAGRGVMDAGFEGEEVRELDHALEAFASKVPYENEPDVGAANA